MLLLLLVYYSIQTAFAYVPRYHACSPVGTCPSTPRRTTSPPPWLTTEREPSSATEWHYGSRSLTALACGRAFIAPATTPPIDNDTVRFRVPDSNVNRSRLKRSFVSSRFLRSTTVPRDLGDARSGRLKQQTTMEEDQNGVVVVGAAAVGRPPNSETCGMIVNHSGGEEGPTPTAAAAAAAPPTPALPAAAATAFGAPARPAPRYGAHLNCNNNNSVIKGQLKGPGNLDHRNRRTRRGKRKSRKQTPYMKDGMLYRDKAVAPNNTNQFLMDDHNDGPDIDKKLLARYSNENGRTRNSSYTSVESEGEQMYSSSDDDGTSIQKEFIDTYRLIQEEQLAGLTSSELIQRVIELEEKFQTQDDSSKRFKKNMITYSNGIPKEEDEDNSIDIEAYRAMQIQNRELIAQNKLLQAEIESLKQTQSKKMNNDSDSSVDSESSSDSSSSSSSSDGQEIEMKFLVRSSERND